MLQVLIFSFCEESWNVSLAKVIHMASYPPQQLREGLRVKGGLSESVKKEKFVAKIFLFANAEWSYKILWNILLISKILLQTIF